MDSIHAVLAQLRTSSPDGLIKLILVEMEPDLMSDNFAYSIEWYLAKINDFMAAQIQIQQAGLAL